jgi:predicted small metal-binding protein
MGCFGLQCYCTWENCGFACLLGSPDFARLDVHEDSSRRLGVQSVRCRDVDFECGGLVWADIEQEVWVQVVAHVKTVQNLGTISEEMVDQVRRVMREG